MVTIRAALLCGLALVAGTHATPALRAAGRSAADQVVDRSCACMNVKGQSGTQPGSACMGIYGFSARGTYTLVGVPAAACTLKFEDKHNKWVMIDADHKVAMEAKGGGNPGTLSKAKWHGKDSKGNKVPCKDLQVHCHMFNSDCKNEAAGKPTSDQKAALQRTKKLVPAKKKKVKMPSLPVVRPKVGQRDAALLANLKREGKLKNCRTEVKATCGAFAEAKHSKDCWRCVKNHLRIINEGIPHMCPLSTIASVCNVTDPKLLALSNDENPTCEKQLHVFCRDHISDGKKCEACIDRNLQQITNYLPGDVMCSRYQMHQYCSDTVKGSASAMQKKFEPGMEKYLMEHNMLPAQLNMLFEDDDDKVTHLAAKLLAEGTPAAIQQLIMNRERDTGAGGTLSPTAAPPTYAPTAAVPTQFPTNDGDGAYWYGDGPGAEQPPENVKYEYSPAYRKKHKDKFSGNPFGVIDAGKKGGK